MMDEKSRLSPLGHAHVPARVRFGEVAGRPGFPARRSATKVPLTVVGPKQARLRAFACSSTDERDSGQSGVDQHSGHPRVLSVGRGDHRQLGLSHHDAARGVDGRCGLVEPVWTICNGNMRPPAGRSRRRPG